MAVSLRSLYGRVAFLRPDLEETAKIGFAIQEAVRDVCRRTFLARGTLTLTIPIGGAEAPLALPPGQGLLIIHRVDHSETGGDGFRTLGAASYSLLDSAGNTPGQPIFYSQQGGVLTLSPPSRSGGTTKVFYSYAPTTTVDTIDLPEAATLAISALAESLVLRVPSKPGGPNYQDLGHAKERENDFHRAIGNLKAISFYGEVGEIVVHPEPFPGAP